MLRILVGITLFALVGAGLIAYATAEEPKAAASDAAVARHAHRLLREDGTLLDEALTRTEALDTAALRRLVLEMRSQVKIRGVLERKRVKGLMWEATNLDQIVSYLRTITGLNYFITPRTRAEQFECVSVTLSLDDVSVATVLDLVTGPYGLAWIPQNGVVQIMTVEELASEPQDAERVEGGADADSVFRAKIDATQVNLNVEAQKFTEVVKLLALQTGFNFKIDPRIASDIEDVLIAGMLFEDIALDTCLNLLQATAGEDVVWTTQGEVIVFTHRRFLNR